MYILSSGISQPYLTVRLYYQLTDTIQGNNIKLSYRFIILRRITCCHQNPSFRNLMTSKSLILKKCQHRRCQGFRYAVDLINKKDSLFFSCFLHTVIDRSYDLAHRIICNHHSLTAIVTFHDLRQTDSTLTGMMRDRIGHKPNPALRSRLFHNGSLTDSRRTDQQNWSLTYQRINIISILILR